MSWWNWNRITRRSKHQWNKKKTITPTEQQIKWELCEQKRTIVVVSVSFIFLCFFKKMILLSQIFYVFKLYSSFSFSFHFAGHWRLSNSLMALSNKINVNISLCTKATTACVELFTKFNESYEFRLFFVCQNVHLFGRQVAFSQKLLFFSVFIQWCYV